VAARAPALDRPIFDVPASPRDHNPFIIRSRAGLTLLTGNLGKIGDHPRFRQ